MSAYFDHNASTPVGAEARAAMVRVLDEIAGNPSSIHTQGQKARQAVETARRQVAALLHCQPKEIVFTSGGTESDNLAILGAPPGHIVSTQIEHPAVLESLRARGNYTLVPARPDGTVDSAQILAAIRPGETVMVSLMHANNETGAIQELPELPAGILLHSDGVQAAGKIPLDMSLLPAHLYSLTGHKFSAPKGAGVLFVRHGVQLSPRQFGGRHENALRAGTENVPAIAALGAAAEWLSANLEREAARVAALRDRLEAALVARIPHTQVNGEGAPRTPNTTNIRFQGVEGEALLIALDLAGFAVSSGAACSSGAVNPSHVLTAMGLSKEEAKSSIRFSLGRTNTVEEVDALIEAVERNVARLRGISPFHAMQSS
jgi:cysteine desulfurase